MLEEKLKEYSKKQFSGLIFVKNEEGEINSRDFQLGVRKQAFILK